MADIKEKVENELKTVKSLCETMENAIKTQLDKGLDKVNTHEMYEAVDIYKDLSEVKKNIIEGCYKMQIMEAMDKEDEEEKKQDEYALMRLKEEYGEDEGQRYYNEWRYANGRYAPKGRGSRRGYTVPIRYLISPDSDRMSPEEWRRDMDRWDYDRMYYAGQGGNSGSSSNRGSSGNMSGSNSSRGYDEGYNEGNRRGYEDGNREGYERGYSEGERRGRSMSQRDGREGRSGQSRRSYMESKEMHTDNSPESKQAKMKELEKYMNELSSDMSEMISGASNEEKTMLRTKLQNLQQKIV